MHFLNYLRYQELGKSKAFIYDKKNSDQGLDSINFDKDLSFVLNRLQCKSEDIFLITGLAESSVVPPFQSRFCPSIGYQNIFSLASEEGKIIILDSNKTPKKSLLKEWQAHDNAIFDLVWAGHDKLISASGDKTAILWDVLSQQQLAICKGHGCSIKTLSIHPNNPNVFASGSRDGNIMLWDIRCKAEGITCHPKFFIGDAHECLLHGTPKLKRRRIARTPQFNNPRNSITCVQFQDESTLLSSGSSDRKIKGWDLRFLNTQKGSNKAPITPFEIEYCENGNNYHGCTSLVLHPNKSSFFANCTDGVIYQYSCSHKMPKLVSTYYGHKVGSFFVKMDISHDGKYIISGSSDTHAYIWKVSKPGPPVLRLSGHDAEVTAVGWCPSDFTKVITCSDDDRVLNWSLSNLEETNSTPANPVVGKAVLIEQNEISCPIKTPKRSESTPQFPSNLISPVTPTSKTRLNSRALTRWFTPTTNASKSETSCAPTPPKTPTLNTPVKTQTQSRPALCDLSLKRNLNSPSTESFMSMKKRLLEEQKLMATGAACKNIRRTLDLGAKTTLPDADAEKVETATPSTSSACNLKENCKDVVDAKGNNNAAVRKSPVKKTASPRKNLKRLIKSVKKPSYSIKHFFNVVTPSDNNK